MCLVCLLCCNGEKRKHEQSKEQTQHTGESLSPLFFFSLLARGSLFVPFFFASMKCERNEPKARAKKKRTMNEKSKELEQSVRPLIPLPLFYFFGLFTGESFLSFYPLCLTRPSFSPFVLVFFLFNFNESEN